MNRRSYLCFTAITVVSLILMAGCAGLEGLVATPTARVESVEISSISFDSVTVQVNVEIDNPNPLGVTLDAYDYGLDAWDSEVVSGRVEDPVSLRAGGKSDLPIPVTLTFPELADVGTSMAGAESVPLDIALGLEIAVPYMGAIRLDLSAFIDIPIPRPPAITPVRIQVDSINLSGAQVSLVMEMGNPNSFSMGIRRLSGSFMVGGRSWGEIGLDESVDLAPDGRQSAVVTARISFADVGRSAWSLLTGSGSARVSMSGDADIDLDIPGFNGSSFDWDADADVSIVR